MHANQLGELVDGLKMLEDELFLAYSTYKRLRELVPHFTVAELPAVDFDLAKLDSGLYDFANKLDVQRDLVCELLALVQR